FLTDNFPPEVNAPAARTYEHCREWVKAGVAVTVITCAPNFPQGRVYEGYRNRLWQQEMVDGIRVIRVWSYVSANEGFAKRILDYVSYAVTAFLAALFVRSDLIVATSPQFFTAVAGYAAGLVKRRPWVMEVRDLWPESIRAVGAAPGRERWLDRLERLELFLYRKAARVVVVTDAFKENLIRRGVDPARIDVVKNGVLLDAYRPRPRPAALAKELSLTGKFVVAYIGTHGMAHGLDFILDCTRDAPPGVHFLFVGGGARKEKLAARVERERLSNVTMLPPVSKDAVADYIALSDVCLVNLKKSDTFKTVIPSKIFENAAMRRPILLGVAGESREIIDLYGAGIGYAPENRTEFPAALDRLRSDSGFYEQCQDGCERLAAAFDRRELAARMLLILKSVPANDNEH
ncbi:MAG: glycosyltransferase family 4 protein, partial [Saprospiraceae bacterium]